MASKITLRQLLDRMQQGEVPERRIEGDREVWRVGREGTSCSTAVRVALERKLVTGFYPSGRGYVHLVKEDSK